MRNALAKILDGKVVRDMKRTELATRVKKCARTPVLAIVQVGDLAESNTYIAQKKKFGEEIGAEVRHVRLSGGVGQGDAHSDVRGDVQTDVQGEVLKVIAGLNADASVCGVIVQLPLPAGLDKGAQQLILNAVALEKDVDGLREGSGFMPATARGVLSLLRHYGVAVADKRVAVIGRSALVGRPIATALTAQKAIVTVCHSKTEDIAKETRPADIIIVAIGKPRHITVQHLSSGQVVIDVGTSRLEEGLVGDVDFDAARAVVAAISPVPGGVGPLTVASLFESLLDACEASGQFLK